MEENGGSPQKHRNKKQHSPTQQQQQQQQQSPQKEKQVITLLVVDENPGLHSTDWSVIFAPFANRSSAYTLVVEQASWKDISLTAYAAEDNVVVDLAASSFPVNERQKKSRTIIPSFLLIRNMPYALHWDYRSTLYALMHAGIPAVNSLHATYMCLERPVVFGALREIQRRVGAENFPLIEQNCHSAFNQLNFTPRFPIVVKVSHTHAGYGKAKVNDSSTLGDLKSVIALHRDYCMVEPFLDAVYDIRVQKIGNSYRAFKRVSCSDSWKTNAGFSDMEEIDMTDRFRMWADECCQLFGGIDVLAIDAIHTRDGEDYILEMNDVPGLLTATREDDLCSLRDLVMEKLDVFVANKNAAPKRARGAKRGAAGSPSRIITPSSSTASLSGSASSSSSCSSSSSSSRSSVTSTSVASSPSSSSIHSPASNRRGSAASSPSSSSSPNQNKLRVPPTGIHPYRSLSAQHMLEGCKEEDEKVGENEANEVGEQHTEAPTHKRGGVVQKRKDKQKEQSEHAENGKNAEKDVAQKAPKKKSAHSFEKRVSVCVLLAFLSFFLVLLAGYWPWSHH